MVSVKTKQATAPTAGATLVELVVALAVVTVGLFGVLQSYLVAMDKTRVANEYYIATRALSNEIETLRGLPFEELADGPGQPFRSRTPELERLVQAEATVSIVDRSGATHGLKLVRAQLRWRGDNGRRIEKQLVSLIANRAAAPTANESAEE